MNGETPQSATGSQLIDFLKPLQAMLMNLFGSVNPSVLLWLALAAGTVLLLRKNGFVSRVLTAAQDIMFSNWRLGLLGATGLVLSLASGWTTWDGMRNFTGEPILSFMVTFGIQGVMLIVAWLIGEAFATGMTQRSRGSFTRDGGAGSSIGINGAMALSLVGLLGLLLWGGDAFLKGGLSASNVASIFGVLGGISLLIGLFIIAARAETLSSYFDATRVMVRTAVLWVMFLACMATSVFFSFDSLFSTIFPQEERKRAAELRAQNQVAGIIADIGTTITQRQISEAETLFKAQGWTEFEQNLVKLTTAAASSQGEIERYFAQQMEDRRRAIATQQERISTSQASQAGLSQKKTALTDEIARIRAERPALAEDFGAKKAVVEGMQKELDAKRVEAMAEERGVEGTGKQGRGPEFRKRETELAGIRDKIKIAEERLRDSQRRFTGVESRITQIERELALIEGDLAKLKGEAQTAESRIKLAETATTQTTDQPQIDPAQLLPAFDRLRNEFRQRPTVEKLAEVQQMCGQMLTAMSNVETTKAKVRGIDCDPKAAAEAATRVFSLNTGVVTFGNNCAGGEKLTALKGADALFEFSRKCVQDSGLAAKDTDALRQKINFIELNRDDKANRFVVTWNAFQDGNRLAYLALAIAVAIDSLVFMSGLFGANAVRSPLSDVPTTKARSAEQLEAIIEAALLPDKYRNARLARSAMYPINPLDGFTNAVDLATLDPETGDQVRDVLNAGATIGAVRQADKPGRYLVRAELYEFLSDVIKREAEKNKDLVKINRDEQDLETRMKEAMYPYVEQSVDIVLANLHPIEEDDGFTSEIRMPDVVDDHKPVIRNVLNAGATLRKVRPALDTAKQPIPGTFDIHGDLYKALARLRTRSLLSNASPLAIEAAHRAPIDLTRKPPALPPVAPQGQSEAKQLAAPTPAQPAAATPPAAPQQRASASVPQPPPASTPQSDLEVAQWRDRYRAELLAAIGFPNANVSMALGNPDVYEAVLAASSALREQANANSRLAALLKQYQDWRVEELNLKYRAIQEAIKDGAQRDGLDLAVPEIERDLPLLMMFPETGLLQHLVAKLEQGLNQDGLPATESSLLNRLRAAYQAIRIANLADPSVWRSVSEQLTPPGLPGNVARFQNPRRQNG